MRAALLTVFAAAALALLGAGCGSSSTAGSRTRDATLVLDFTPNAIHAGIYASIARGFDRQAGIHLHVVAPAATTDSIKLLQSGRADYAILDIHDLAIARERGQDVVAIMAIVEHPLAAVIAAPSIPDPRGLEGHTVGVTGVPSDSAVLHSIVAGAGGDPGRLHTITIGFNAVAALLSHRVAAATAFWNDEGVTLRRSRPGFHVFRVDDYGAPSYPELVLCATGSGLRRDPGLARAMVHTLVRGYGVVLSDPRASESELEARVPGLDPRLVAAELSAERPALIAPDGRFGELNLSRLRAWARWEARFRIVARPPDVVPAFDPRFVAGGFSPRGLTRRPAG